jgi:hypothetical protein
LPGVENVGLATGSLAYSDTVTAPKPAPLAVVASFVTLQVPDVLEDEQFCELVAPAGGEGGEGGEDDEGGEPPDGGAEPPDGGGVTTAGLTVRAKPHVPVSPLLSPSVPETVYVPGASEVVALIAPVELTTTSVEAVELVSV